jgi:hypothetical protein
MKKIGLLLLLLMLLVGTSSQAADAVSTPATKPIPFVIDVKKQIRLPAPVKIKKVVDQSALLSDTGDIYSLTGLDIPDDNDTAPKTQKRLAELTEGKKCTLYQTRSEKIGRLNRMNQIVAHFTCGKNDEWIQGTLIAEGLARVRTTPENEDQAAAMLALEQQARDKKIGLWALPMNAVLTPVNAAQRMNSFGIIQGKVYAASQNRNAIFLNFTADWKTDFSIGIPSTLRKDFSKLRIDPMSLKGKTVRVRGWIRSYNGPYIELDHAEQLEILSDKSAPATPDPQTEMQDKALDILDKIVDSTRSEPSATTHDPNQQFMHTIGGKKAQSLVAPEPPQITEPTVPEVKKPVVAPVERKLNQ